jgi:hypothetical protein
VRAGGNSAFSSRFTPQHIETEQRGAHGPRVITCPGELEPTLACFGERFCSSGSGHNIEPGCSQLGHSSSQHHQLWIQQVQRVGESDTQCYRRLVHHGLQMRMAQTDLIHQGHARFEPVLDGRA